MIVDAGEVRSKWLKTYSARTTQVQLAFSTDWSGQITISALDEAYKSS